MKKLELHSREIVVDGRKTQSRADLAELLVRSEEVVVHTHAIIFGITAK